MRAYVAPPTAYSSLPLSRRAAVLILLFADRRGDLRVVLTMRASTLNSCRTSPNHAPQVPCMDSTELIKEKIRGRQLYLEVSHADVV